MELSCTHLTPFELGIPHYDLEGVAKKIIKLNRKEKLHIGKFRVVARRVAVEYFGVTNYEIFILDEHSIELANLYNGGAHTSSVRPELGIEGIRAVIDKFSLVPSYCSKLAPVETYKETLMSLLVSKSAIS